MRLAVLNILFSFLFSVVYAQDPAFKATVSKNKIPLDEQFTITYTLDGAGSNFMYPSFTDHFYQLSGPSQSHSMEIINGNMSQYISYSFVLQPRQEGKFTFPPATIESDGKKLQSNSITVEAVKGNVSTQPPGGQGQNKDDRSADIFLKAVVDNRNAYLGEQITISYKIYTRISIITYNVEKNPSFTGFWTQDIEQPDQIQLTQEILNGVPYQVATVKQVAAFPQKTGKLTVESMQILVTAKIKSKSNTKNYWDFLLNDPFFNTRNVNVKLTSDPVPINVKALPESKKPADYNGVVGKYSLLTTLDKYETKTNDAITLKIKITGTGNIKLIQPPKLDIPSTIEIYEPKVTDNLVKGQSTISGSKTMEYLLIPRHEGQHSIVVSPYTYFDPSKNDYVTISESSLSISVLKGDNVTGSSTMPGFSKEEIEVLGLDIRFIKSGNVNFIKTVKPLWRSVAFYTWTITPFLLFILFVALKRHHSKTSSDIILLKRIKANKLARKRLAIAQKFLKQNNKELFYNEISKVLWGYMADKLSIQSADLSQEIVKEKLSACQVNNESINKFILTVDYCEMARFAPSNNGISIETMYNDTIILLSDLEHEIKIAKRV